MPDSQTTRHEVAHWLRNSPSINLRGAKDAYMFEATMSYVLNVNIGWKELLLNAFDEIPWLAPYMAVTSILALFYSAERIFG